MKVGLVSQTVCKRSILKLIGKKYQAPSEDVQDVLLAPAVEEMCAGLRVPEGRDVLYTTCSLYGNEKDLGVFAIAKAVNDLASRGASPRGIQAVIQLTTFAYESRLKSMAAEMEQACEAQGLVLQSVRAEVVPVLSSSMVSVTASGIVKEQELLHCGQVQKDQDIVLVGWVGLEGTLRVMREKEEELKARFIPAFLNQVEALSSNLFSLDAIDMAIRSGASAIQQIGSGGILAALWEMAEAGDVGLTVEQKKLSIKQETIEICEFYRMNPYQLTSTGSLLIMIDNGKALVRQMDEAGIYAEVIGRTTDARERVMSNGEEKRFLDRPAPDELARIYAEAYGN